MDFTCFKKHKKEKLYLPKHRTVAQQATDWSGYAASFKYDCYVIWLLSLKFF